MKIKEKFKKIKKENPDLENLECFAYAIKGEDYSEKTIRRAFDRLLIPDKDYEKEKKRHILQWLLGKKNYIVISFKDITDKRTFTHLPNFYKV